MLVPFVLSERNRNSFGQVIISGCESDVVFVCHDNITLEARIKIKSSNRHTHLERVVQPTGAKLWDIRATTKINRDDLLPGENVAKNVAVMYLANLSPIEANLLCDIS